MIEKAYILQAFDDLLILILGHGWDMGTLQLSQYPYSYQLI